MNSRLYPMQPTLLMETSGKKFYECPSCGNVVRRTGNYCDKCGQRFEWEFCDLLEKYKDEELICQIIKYRFVDGLTVEKVAEKAYTSTRNVYRILAKIAKEWSKE